MLCSIIRAIPNTLVNEKIPFFAAYYYVIMAIAS